MDSKDLILGLYGALFQPDQNRRFRMYFLRFPLIGCCNQDDTFGRCFALTEHHAFTVWAA
jgi:hypothetical protein